MQRERNCTTDFILVKHKKLNLPHESRFIEEFKIFVIDVNIREILLKIHKANQI